MSEPVQATSDDSFEADVLQSELPVLVDFWAEWCGPCKMIAPILKEVASEYDGRIKFMKVNVEENKTTPAQYGVRAIPSLVLFKSGNVAATHVGALTRSQLTAFLDQNT